MKARFEDEKKLFVEVGAGVVVRKTPEEAQEVIKKQIQRFHEVKMHLTAQLHEYAEEFRRMVGKLRRKRVKVNKC